MGSRDMGPHDGGPRDGGGHDGEAGTGDMSLDMTSMLDHGVDMGSMCGGVMCMGFEYCSMGHCTAYPGCAPDGSCTETGDVCRSRHCVPGTADIDGDGSPASVDCDETNPMVHPGATDVCNGIDDDCNGHIDDGPVATLCAPGTGICTMGMCGCPPDHYDLDTMPGCECVGMPGMATAASCMAAQSLGAIPDTGAMATVSGNALPAGREDWYSFHAVDTADSSCDTFNVHVFFTSNPSSVFEFTVFRGMCGAVECGDTGFIEYNFNTHLSMGMTGECPCAPATAGVNNCGDETADFFVRVRRKMGTTTTCDGYVLEVTNGL